MSHWRRFSARNYDNTRICITVTKHSGAYVYRAHMVGPFTVSLCLGLATLTGSHLHCDNDARSHIAGIESPFGYNTQWKVNMTLNIDRLLLFLLPYIGFRTSVSTLQRFHLPLCPKFHTEAVSLFCTLYSSYSCMCYFHPALLLPFWLKGNPLKSGNFRYSYVIIGISPNYVACALLFFCLTWYSPPQIW